jgi:hypothetical protein
MRLTVSQDNRQPGHGRFSDCTQRVTAFMPSAIPQNNDE